MEAQLAAAFLIGLLGGVHCVGMCGGVVGALTATAPCRDPDRGSGGNPIDRLAKR